MYVKPTDEITFSDVAAFIQEKNRENIILDYKGDWPRNLAKVIAAMANTQGGLIFIGVTEENNSGRPEDVVGVDLGRGEDQLRQRVISTAFQGIYPPVMPEVGACLLDSDPSRAVVIIRVVPSDRTPHAVDNRTKIYVRVDSQTVPYERLAALNELEWLWDRRRLAIENRDALVEAAMERAAWMLEPPVDIDEPSVLRVWVVPYFYSGEEALSPGIAQSLVSSRRVSSGVLGGWTFPNFARRSRSVPGGYCIYSSGDLEIEYDELGTSGLLFSELKLCEVHEQTGWKQLHIGLILNQIDGLLGFASLAYEQGQVWGLLQVQASLHHVQGAILYGGVEERRGQRTLDLRRSPNAVVRILDETIDKRALEVTRPNLVKQATRTLLWAFGHAWDEAAFEQWYSEILR